MTKSPRNDARAERLARKLKENLKRRKAQKRARAGSGTGTDRKKDAEAGNVTPVDSADES